MTRPTPPPPLPSHLPPPSAEVGSIKGEAEARVREAGDAGGERARLLQLLAAREQELEHYKAEVARCVAGREDVGSGWERCFPLGAAALACVPLSHQPSPLCAGWRHC